MVLTGQFDGKEPGVGEKAQQILKTAERLFAEGRYHEVTLDEICRKAGVGKGTIYRYFDDKEDLYYQVILTGMDELVDSIRQVGTEEEDPGEGLRRVARSLTTFFTERRSLFGLMHSEELRGSTRKGEVWKQWRAKSHKIVDVIADFIRDGLESGRYTTRFEPAMAATFLKSMLRAGVWHRDEMPGGADWPVWIIELFEQGMLVRQEGNS
jgi:TetR/AcrR family fatty acid metabolism transcriptional regulator